MDYDKTINELYSIIYEDGRWCPVCPYNEVTREPHGEVLRECTIDGYTLSQCPPIKKLLQT